MKSPSQAVYSCPSIQSDFSQADTKFGFRSDDITDAYWKEQEATV